MFTNKQDFLVLVEFMALEVCFLSPGTIDNIGFESILCKREKKWFCKNIVIFSSYLSFKNGKRKLKSWFVGHNKKTSVLSVVLLRF